MSRSNPSEHAVNPATRWFEWDGSNGTVRYYDKAKKENVDVGTKFEFVLLDELASVRGWDERNKSGIYSNEVRDTRTDLLVVKSFKGGEIATGLYQQIKDRVNNAGGDFNANLYIAYKGDDGRLAIGALRFKGAALGAWSEFRKAHRGELYTAGLRITGFKDGKKGNVKFRVPVFDVKAISPESDKLAADLDKQLQEYLVGYLKKTKTDQVESVARHVSDEEIARDMDADRDLADGGYESTSSQMPDDSDIPF